MEQALIALAGIAVGAAIWLWILRRYDRIEPESVRHLVQVALFGGFVSVAAAAFLNEAAREALGVVANVFEDADAIPPGRLLLFCLFIGFSEEITKAIAAVYTTRWVGDLNEPIDAMIYAMMVGLGFAAFENFLYAARFGNDVLLARFLWPVPAHMAYAALWGYGLARARFLFPKRNTAWVMAPSVLLAALLHAVANFLLFLQMTATAMLSLAALVGLAALAHYRLKRLVHESPFLEPGECPSCRHHNLPDATMCAQCDEPLDDTEMFVSCPCGCTRVPAFETHCPVCGIAMDAVLPPGHPGRVTAGALGDGAAGTPTYGPPPSAAPRDDVPPPGNAG